MKLRYVPYCDASCFYDPFIHLKKARMGPRAETCCEPCTEQKQVEQPSSFIDISPELIYNLQDTVVLPKLSPQRQNGPISWDQSRKGVVNDG